MLGYINGISIPTVSDIACLCVRCLSAVALKSALPHLLCPGGAWAHLKLVYCGMSGVRCPSCS